MGFIAGLVWRGGDTGNAAAAGEEDALAGEEPAVLAAAALPVAPVAAAFDAVLPLLSLRSGGCICWYCAWLCEKPLESSGTAQRALPLMGSRSAVVTAAVAASFEVEAMVQGDGWQASARPRAERGAVVRECGRKWGSNARRCDARFVRCQQWKGRGAYCLNNRGIVYG